MAREYWHLNGIKGLKSDIKNKFGTKSYQIRVPKDSQPQLLKISQNPKEFEDTTNGNQSKFPIEYIRNGPLTRPGTGRKSDNIEDTITKNVELIKLHDDDDTESDSFSQAVEQNARIKAIQKKEYSTLEYVAIKNGLREKIEKFPGICSIPFFVTLNQNGYPLTKGASSACVALPCNVQMLNTNTSWETITSQLIKVKEYFHQHNRQNFSFFFQPAVQSYRPDCQQWSNFQMLDRPDILSLLKATLPFIADQALILPNLLENPVPNLISNESKTLYLTRKLCCSLLANAFFCTFPEPKIGQMPDFNFFRLFNDTQSQRCEVKKEKIKCLLQYFRTMNKYQHDKTFQNQIVSFERRYVTKKVNWALENGPLCEIKVDPCKKIEEADNMLQVDFANKVVGGGVLNDGSVMEEIRFCISPELLVSRLFTQTLNDNEVLVVTGTEIFSRYKGYSTSFEYQGPSNADFEKHSTDNFGRTFTQVVAMDACSFKRNEAAAQFKPKLIDRELHKAYVAFIHGKAGSSPVATGNWGCGAFNGNQELKFLIQWMAASHQGRPSMLYHTIGDKMQTHYVEDLSGFLCSKNVTVGGLYKSISQFSSTIGNKNIQAGALFQHVKRCFNI